MLKTEHHASLWRVVDFLWRMFWRTVENDLIDGLTADVKAGIAGDELIERQRERHRSAVEAIQKTCAKQTGKLPEKEADEMEAGE